MSDQIWSYYSTNKQLGKNMDRIKELSSIDANVQSLEALQRDYENKIEAIKAEANNYRETKKAAFTQQMNNTTYNSNLEKSTGALLTTLGQMAINAEASKKAQQAKEQLESEMRAKKAEFEEQKRQMEEAKRQAEINSRKNLIDAYSMGGLPKANVNYGKVYFFAYSSNDVESNYPMLKITHVFEVNQYGDGEWPFKIEIQNKLKNSGMENCILVGFYSNQNQIEEEFEKFQLYARKTGFGIQQMKFGDINKTSFNQNNNQERNTNEQTQPVKKKDDFWNE